MWKTEDSCYISMNYPKYKHDQGCQAAQLNARTPPQ